MKEQAQTSVPDQAKLDQALKTPHPGKTPILSGASPCSSFLKNLLDFCDQFLECFPENWETIFFFLTMIEIF